MNIYDTKQVKCSVCGKSIGEIGYDSVTTNSLCGSCSKKENKANRKDVKKILVPVDMTKKSTRALDIAIYLSKNLGSHITIMQVIPTVAIGCASFFKDIFKELSKDAEESIKWAKEYCERENLIVKHKIVNGDEAEGILKTAKKNNYDLIIMGSSGKNAFKELLFGSISNYVTHNSNIPILTVKEESAKLGSKVNQGSKIAKKNKTRLRGGNGTPFSKMKQRASINKP